MLTSTLNPYSGTAMKQRPAPGRMVKRGWVWNAFFCTTFCAENQFVGEGLGKCERPDLGKRVLEMEALACFQTGQTTGC